MLYPILMADVIGSGKKNPTELMARLKETVDEANAAGNLLSPLTITLGDEFQGVAATLTDAIATIFRVEEIIIRERYGFKLKYVLNFGDIGTEINPEVAYEMLGEGLTLARENLGMLKSQDRRFLVLLEPGREPLQDLLNKLFVIYEDYVDSWKPKDLGIVHRFLAREDYKSVAESVGIDPSSAWRRRRSLNIREYETIKEIILTVCNRS